ncbi:molybdate ABC transporter substrate-binding protein [Longimicrobium sp.]|uniref:molybdate ABC transporter substrate-binding protein n=1 Tax=Longimicrobium sp. TaxID=2029185 RepID=UPI003B3B7C3B
MQRRFAPLTALLVMLAACGGGSEEAAKSGAEKSSGEAGGEVMVFAAASLREAMEELGAGFEKETGVEIVFNFAGSNDLAHQIAATRGPDIFLSASKAWMDTVQSGGRVLPGSRRDLLSNTLVVVASARDTSTVAEPCALATMPFRNLAMGDPEAVPAGTYARAWLRSVQCGGRPLWDAVQARVAPAPDVRAALGLVLADPRVIGIVYKTDQMAFADRTRVLYEVRDGPAIRTVIARLTEGRGGENGARFYEHLVGATGAEVFRKHGFDPLPAAAP